jgi:hypothetical protein
MATKKQNIDRVAFSWWLAWFYRQIPNFEEPVDPNNPYHQIASHLAIHEMARVISDRAVREEIQSIIDKSIANIAQKNAN